MGTRTTDCRKFTPNIFNKSKCSHCFRAREEHSAAALESNRASRKVSKCGYLFVAPDWDFNNPLYRTKRWQRRWFVLYDDGELTYSVDEHPETVPQASIDMTKVLEVSTAEEVTGHTNSIAITAPDRVTFVKGTCPEEAKWWLNILIAFPKAKGRHKRNATFPGGQATTIIQTSAAPNSRNRHNSYHKDTLSSVPGNGLDVIANTWDAGTQNSVVAPPGGQDENNKNAGNEITNRVYADQPVSSKSPPTRDKIHPESKAQARIRNRSRTAPSIQDDSEPASSCLLIEDVRRDEKLKDIANTITNLSQMTNNRWSSTTTVPSPNTPLGNQSFDDKPTRDETDFHPSKQDFHKVINLRPKSLPLASSTAPAIVSAIVKKIPPVSSDSKSSPRLQSLKHAHHHCNQQNQSQERGDPDGGCNMDDISTNYLSKTSELRVNLPAEEILNSKKGWLMKLDSRTGEWTKHWFTLRGAALFYYRDPVSEERGVLDGVLDVNSLTNISEITASRNYGLQLTTWDNRRIVLASVSANSRSNWINVLRNAAGIQPPPEPKTSTELEPELIIKDETGDDLKSEIEKDFMKAQRNQEIIITPEGPSLLTPKPAPTLTTTPVSPPKPVNVSSDEEYRTASEGGRRDSIDWGSPLSPSPPVPLVLFRAKERMRSRSGSSPRLHKRSRSSPPSSRRSTVDSVGSDELPLIHPVQEELNIDKELQIRLGVAEKERDMLREEAREREARMSELLSTLERTELELTARIREVEEARDNLSRQLSEANCRAEKIVNRLTAELEESQAKIKDLEDRLSRGIEENEGLYKKLREMEGCNSSSFSNLNRSKMRRVDSLSDLTNLTEIDPYGLERDNLADEYNELRSRFEKAVNEIKAMKKELRESQNQYDTLEISYTALKQDLERKENEDRGQLQMMAERIQDLTLKYTSSERQVRTLKQKLAKSERRRTSSLKGKDQILVPKELEEKVSELETKIADLERTSPDKLHIDESPAKGSSASSRRRSLESSGSTDSLQFMVRLNALEKRIENASSSPKVEASPPMRSQTSPKMSEHLVERLKCLEGVLVSSKDRIEQSLQQLQSLRSSRTRRSVSPITDRKDSFRFVERCLTEVVKLMRESCETCIIGECANSSGVLLLPESNPIKLALMQLEAQLRSKLGDLLKQRRVLRERNELSSRKGTELLAERIAFESVCFGKLRDSISRAEDPSLFGEKQTRAEVAETSQLMSMLKAKLGGKCAFKPSGSLDILAGVLARRLVLSSYRKTRHPAPEMPPVDPKVMNELLRQQNEINIISKRYKNNAMETLASGLAAETLSYMSSTDAVQGAVQEAWRQAQETVNAELVQSEIAHIMLRNAERFENSITPSFGYTLTVEERVTFENFADAVHDTLRREMDNAIGQLTRCYEDSLQKMKRGQWRLHLEQERKASEGRQLLSEFADIIAHKALVDARIAVLKGDYIQQSSSPQDKHDFSVVTLQKYENLFDELANDLQICNPDDILAEADFNFMYKKYAIEFLSDRPHLKEVSDALSKLEESIVLLHSTLNPNTSVSSPSFNIESLKDICVKCRELRKRIDGMIGCAQKLASPCVHCEKMQNSLCSLTAQHETEIKSLQQVHDKDLTALRRQLEEHVGSIKALENERNSLLEELNLQSNLVEDHERELAAITMKLKSKEEECHRRDNENLDLTERLESQESRMECLEKEKVNLSQKCVQQDEEYAALLRERDYIQSELNKERERSRKLEKRLEMLELEHSRQLECLQEAYKDQILSHCSDFTGIADEESFRQRYQTEIEQLRTLCEKGLAAMESSHRRIINDLEEKHRKEIDRLLIEKEQALAEETQATLAALDAMRKAHQSEVQREVARFKQDFLRQFQKGEQPSVQPREKEEELEELRQEILSFSEKYSIKCVENAALEERLRAANQKLKQFHQMQQLELRNKQFRAHLASEDPSDLNFVQGLTKDSIPCPDSEHENVETVANARPFDACTKISDQRCNDYTLPLCQKPYYNKESHPRSGFKEGVKVTTTAIYNDDTSPVQSKSPPPPQEQQAAEANGRTAQSTTANSRKSSNPPTTIPNDSNRIDRLRSLSNNTNATAIKAAAAATDKAVQLLSESEPVEQPKTSKILAPKNVNMKVVNLSISEALAARKKSHHHHHHHLQQHSYDHRQGDADRYGAQSEQQTTESDRPTRSGRAIQRRLAVNLSSLNELLNPNSSTSQRGSRRSSISDASITNPGNKNSPTNPPLSTGRSGSAAPASVLTSCSIGRRADLAAPRDRSSVDCSRFDHSGQLESMALAKKCSPPPLSGRDVEHHTTSHLRRFELEI